MAIHAEIVSLDSRLKDLAPKINEQHSLCEQSLRAGLQHAIKAGQLLIEAKALCTHGDWGKWLEDNCTVSQRAAQLYMRVARGLPLLEGKAQHVADLSLREAAALLAAPANTESERADRFVEWAAGVLADVQNQLVLLQLALQSARTMEQVTAIIKAASEQHGKASEVYLRGEREAGGIFERAPEAHHEAIRLCCAVLMWADEHGVSGDDLFREPL